MNAKDKSAEKRKICSCIIIIILDSVCSHLPGAGVSISLSIRFQFKWDLDDSFVILSYNMILLDILLFQLTTYSLIVFIWSNVISSYSILCEFELSI